MARYNKYECYFVYCPLSSGLTNVPYKKPDLFPESSIKETLHMDLSNWLLAVRSGDRIPVGSRFSTPVQTSSEAHPASYTGVLISP
jgi:hypothetical protein